MKIIKLIPTFMAIVVGFLMAKFIFSLYDTDTKLTTTFKQTQTVYFLQVGVYSSKENMESSTSSFPYYIYKYENNLYYVFVAMTKNKEVLSKLKGYYKDLGYNIYEKEYNVSNSEFLELLNEYDDLLLKVEDVSTYKTIIGNVLKKYEEVVVNSGKN